jgi:hypothetical protein
LSGYVKEHLWRTLSSVRVPGLSSPAHRSDTIAAACTVSHNIFAVKQYLHNNFIIARPPLFRLLSFHSNA